MTPPERIGRYEIECEIGRGSMGVVYRARDPRIGRVVALKCVAFSFPLSSGEQDEFLARFYHEAQIAGRLSHPHIVTIHDVGVRETDGAAFIAMEYVTGTNLQELLAGGGRLPIPQIAMIARQAADALDYAHASGVVHRDVKPGNLVVTPAGQLKILDFGIARLTTGDITHPGRLMGTPNYMAPEQVTGGAVDGRADQFALAVTLYHLLAGERPFSGESVTAISYQVVNVVPPPPSRLNPSLPPVVDGILARAMSKSAQERYPSCTEFAGEMAVALEGWKQAAERALERTLSSMPPPPHGGLRGGVRARLVRLRGLGATFGVGLALLVLGFLAAAPYLLDGASRSGRALGASAPRGLGMAAPRTGVLPSPAASDPATPRPAGTPAAGTATLVLEFQHRFESGAISVRLDGNVVLREPLRSGGARTLWRREIQVPAGHRRLEVRVTERGEVDDLEGLDLTLAARERRLVSLSVGSLTRRLKMRAADAGTEVAR